MKKVFSATLFVKIWYFLQSNQAFLKLTQQFSLHVYESEKIHQLIDSNPSFRNSAKQVIIQRVVEDQGTCFESVRHYLTF